jgi:hypothetical protein
MRHVIPGRHYQHFKGEVYEVLYIAKCTDTKQDMVVYQNTETAEIWVRKAEEFLGNRPDRQLRFTEVD